jgi:hypothetical protein
MASWVSVRLLARSPQENTAQASDEMEISGLQAARVNSFSGRRL